MRRKTILLIDDETGFTKIVKLTLESAEKAYHVHECNDPSKALQIAREIHPDLIVLDVIMPEVDGGDVLALLKADPVLKKTPVIFLTATVTKQEVTSHNGHIGGSIFLAKPVSLEELERCIEENTPV